MKNLLFIVVIIFTANLTQAQWGADVRLTNDTAASVLTFSRAMGIASNGDSIHVVWHDERDGNFEIYYKRSIDGGLSWGTDTRLTNVDSISSNPAISISGSIIHIVWNDKRDGNGEIYYKRSADGGASWGGDIRLTNATATSYCPSIAVSGSNVHISWTDLRNGNYEIYYKFSTDGGISWGNETRITNYAAMSYNTSISVSGSNVHIIWEDKRNGNGEIYHKRSTDGGLNWGTDTRLTNNSSHSNLPTSAVSGSNLYVVWDDYRNGNWEIYFKHSTDGGLTWGADKRLTNSYGSSVWPKVAVSGSIVHIAWQDNRNGNDEIFYMYSMDGGLSWSSDTLLVNNSATMSEKPSITLSGSAVHLIWQDKRDGPNGEIYYKRNPTGNLIGIKDLNFAKNDINVFPNPALDNISILFPNKELSDISISIFNSLGIEIKRFEEKELVGKNAINFSTESFPSGVYYCTLNYGIKKISRSFVVLR